MVRLISRAKKRELMDAPAFGGEEALETFRQIALTNRLTLAYRPAVEAIRSLWKGRHRHSQEPLRILDVGCGSGDLLREIARWAGKKGIPVLLTGIDLTPWAIRAARRATDDRSIRYRTGDVFKFRPAHPFHIVVNSLFAHHLTERQVVRLLRWMTDQSLYGWFISDLQRHRLAYYFVRYATRWLGFNRFLRADGPLSVARSFTRPDWERLLRRAGICEEKVSIRWRPIFRYGLLYVA